MGVRTNFLVSVLGPPILENYHIRGTWKVRGFSE